MNDNQGVGFADACPHGGRLKKIVVPAPLVLGRCTLSKVTDVGKLNHAGYFTAICFPSL